jgi:hypothetical protein
MEAKEQLGKRIPVKGCLKRLSPDAASAFAVHQACGLCCNERSARGSAHALKWNAVCCEESCRLNTGRGRS